MTSSLFKHGKCGGNLTLNLIQLFVLRSPSIVITSGGISPGVMELHEREGGNATFVCSKCKKDVEIVSEDVTVECNVCHKHHPASKMQYADQLPGVCTDCLDMLTGKKVPSTEAMKIADYVILPKDSGIVFINFSDVLSKRVRATVNPNS